MTVKFVNHVRMENAAPKTPVKTLNPEHFIPELDHNFVSSGNHNYTVIKKIVSSKQFFPIYVSGPSGNGKTSQVFHICAKENRPVIRVNMHNQIAEEDFIGSRTLVNGNIEIVEGPVLMAMRLGAILLVDECDMAPANVITGIFQSILEGKPYFFKLKNEMIVPKNGFNIIATGNSKGRGTDDGRYMGVNIQNEAFLDRFALLLEQEYPSIATEKKIIDLLMKSYDCMNANFAETLSKWSDAIRQTYIAGGIDDLITTRRINHIVKAYGILKDEKQAIEMACNRFDRVTKDAFLNLFEKCHDSSDTIPQVPNDESTDF